MNKKSTLRKSLLAFALLASTGISFGQVIFTENFEGTPNPTTLLPASWTETGLSTDGIFKVGNNASIGSTYFVIPPHTNFAGTNDDLCNCNKSADRLILPVQNFSAITTGLRLNFDAALFSQYSVEKGTVEVSTNGGTTWTPIYNIPKLAGTWQNNLNASLNAYIGQANVLISFKYNDNAGWAQGMGIDNVSIEQVSGVDASLAIEYGEYTVVPLAHVTPITITAKVTNIGIAALTSTPITTEVYLDPNYTTPIATFTQTSANLAVGATNTIIMGVYTPPAIGDYVFFNYITTGDVVTSNDTVIKAVIIDQNEYAHDNADPVSGIGLNPGSTGVIGSTFDIQAAAQLDSVVFMFNPPAATIGNIVQIKVSSVVGTTPSLTYIGQSAPFIITAAHTTGTGAVVTLPVKNMSNGTLVLAAGNYFVGVSKNTLSGENFGLQCADDIYTAGTVYASIDGGAYAELNTMMTGGFPYSPILRPYINPTCTLTATATAIDANCGNADGTATAVPANGIAPFTYLWSNGQTAATATGLAQGTYSVVVTDNQGCDVSVSNVIVNNISTLVTTIAAQAPTTCFGSADGSASISATGGTAPYTYVWTGNPSTTDMATGLSVGVHTVNVTDDAGCSNAINVTITSPTAVTANTTSVDVTCNGGTNGSAVVNAIGGTGSYTYVWTGNASTTNSITNVAAGTYSVVVTDVNGCQATVTAVVVEPTAITITTTSTPESSASNGTANATPTGGTSPYTYAWSNGAATQTITGLTAGTYTVTVTDSKGCVQTSTVTVTSTVGVTEIENGSFTLFPNPSQGMVTLSMEGIATGDISMEIIDVTGKTVFTQNVLFDGNKTNYNLDLSSLENGTYLINISMQEGTATRRIILAD